MMIKQKQLELHFDTHVQLDRNYHLGGKSFYFFDFDDNIAYLSTPIYLFHKKTGQQISVSSGQFARGHKAIGKSGNLKDFTIDLCDFKGSFRNFRDLDSPIIKKGIKQPFIVDIEKALECTQESWKAPSWKSFYYATYNNRPISLITARGHNQNTIKNGIELMVNQGHLAKSPNYLSVYAVSNKDTRLELGDKNLELSVPELKKLAIRESVIKAIESYGHNEGHRFGMSDDDPKNVELITEEMKSLKRIYPEMSFFVIQTFEDSYAKSEVLLNSTRTIVSKKESQSKQLPLF